VLKQIFSKINIIILYFIIDIFTCFIQKASGVRVKF